MRGVLFVDIARHGFGLKYLYMLAYHFSFPTPEQNLAWDEALLDYLDATEPPARDDIAELNSNHPTINPEQIHRTNVFNNTNEFDNSNGFNNTNGFNSINKLDNATDWQRAKELGRADRSQSVIGASNLHTANTRESLRLWSMPQNCVVLGRASKVQQEVDVTACQHHNVPILRRCSGGATVVTGPGCLMYSLHLSLVSRPSLRMLDVAHLVCMQHLRNAINAIPNALSQNQVEINGICDLTYNDFDEDQPSSVKKKFSGNAVRCKRHWLLYHGTILLDFPLNLISSVLLQPPKQPEYRQRRDHDRFVTNLPIASDAIRQSLQKTWLAKDATFDFNACDKSLQENFFNLLNNRYLNPSWHYER